MCSFTPQKLIRLVLLCSVLGGGIHLAAEEQAESTDSGLISEARALMQMADEYQMRQPDRAVEFAEQAVRLVGQRGSLELQFDAQLGLGQALLRADRFADLLETARAARNIASRMGDAQRETSALRMIVGALMPLGDFEQAIEINIQMLQRLEGTDDKEGRYGALVAISALYWQMRDWDAAERFIRQARELKRTYADLDFLDYNNLGIALMEQGRLEDALVQFRLAVDLAKQTDRPYTYALLMSNFGELYQRMGDTATARDYLKNAFNELETVQSDWVRLRSLRHLARVKSMEGDFPGAIADAREAYSLAQAINSASEQMSCLEALVEVHEAGGDYRNALQVSREAAALQEQILSQRVRNQAIIRSVDLDFASQQELIGQLQLKNQVAALEAANLRSLQRAQSFQRNGLLVGSLFLIAALVIMLGQFRTIKNSRLLLQEQQYELTRSNKELRRLMQQKDDFVGIVAHDLRNPLNAILNSVMLLKDDVEPGSLSEEMLGYVQQSSQQMEQIISDLLDLERLNQEEIGSKLQALDIDTAVRGCVQRLMPSARVKRQKVAIDSARELHALGEEKLLVQILDNLISNAIKYAPMGGQIHISSHQLEDGSVRLDIEDDGPGIPLEKRDQLFTKFSRIDSKPTNFEPSTGLGLYLAQKLAEHQSAKITYADREGGGSRFSLHLKA